MDLICEERPSDSPLVERIWYSQSDRAGSFISMAESHWEMVVTWYQDRTTLTVRGPETRATPAFCPANTRFMGIQFKPGTFMPHLPPQRVMDRHELDLPEATSQSFYLQGSAWQFPDYENADTFVKRLVRENLLVWDPVVEAALQRRSVAMSVRTVQRRLLQATGLTLNTVHQITRARYAVTLLKQGMSILDTVEQAGYFDQAHLTRSLKYLIGQTPAQIANRNRAEMLSFLYNTAPPC